MQLTLALGKTCVEFWVLRCQRRWASVKRRVFREIQQVRDLPLQVFQAVGKLHINLVDLIDVKEGTKVTKFPTEVELSRYTIKHKKYFPKEHALAGGLLKELRRHILNPRVQGRKHQERVLSQTKQA
jgi:hypothetical protein